MKHINCHCINGDPMTKHRWEHDARWKIKLLKQMLADFANEEKFEEYEEHGIHLGVGLRTVDITFCPETWDSFSEFANNHIGYLIQSYELERFPYYAQMLEELRKAYGCEDFVY